MLGGSAEHSSSSTRIFLGAAGVTSYSRCETDTFILSATMLAPHVSEVLDRLGETVAAPTFESADVERGKRALNAAGTWVRKYPNASAAVDGMLLGEAHPARIPVFDDERVRRASREDLLKLAQASLTAANLTVAIVGDFQRADVLRVLDARLGRLRRTNAPRTAWHEPPPPEQARIAIVPWRGGTQSKIAFAFIGPPPLSEERMALALLAELLGASLGRLTKKIREEQGATYGVDAHVRWWRTGGDFEINTSVETAHAVATVNTIVHEIGRLAAERVPDEELARAKGRMSSRAESSGGAPYMTHLSYLEKIALQDLPLDYFVRFASLDSVTAEDVRAVAAKVLRLDRVQIAVAADPAAVEAPLRALGLGEVSLAVPR
jgi:predicted Zn-dependent peptidase